MKKAFLIFLILFVLAAIGAVVFALTFDADRYRPLILSKIEESTGLSADLGRVSLGWAGGAALQIRQLTLYQDKQKQKELFKFDSLDVLVHLMPLLNRQLQIGSIVIQEPDIRIVRGPDGMLKGLESASAPKAAKTSTGDTFAGIAFLSTISRAEIHDGRFSFRDESGGYVTETVLEKIDLTVKGISLSGTTPFQARAAFASEKQNIALSGKIRINPFELQQAEFETDLGQARIEDLLKMFPALRNAGLQRIQGRLSADIQGLKTEGEVSWQKGDARLEGGRLQLEGMPSFENLELEAALSKNHADIRKISGGIGEGDFSFTGKVDQIKGRTLAALQGTLRNMDLGQMLPPSSQGEPAFRGKVNLSIEGTAQGARPEEFSTTAAGQGQLTLENGKIENLNVLREVFSRLSMIPGLVPRLQQRLPPAYQEKLQARDTYLEPVQLPFTINQGVLFFDNLNVAADSFALAGGKGTLSPQFIRVQAMLLIDPELSAALIQSVQELSSLTDREGRLAVPINVQGPPSQISVLPDIQYVASKLAVSKISDFLAPKRRTTDVPGDQTQTMPGNPDGEPSSGLDSLRKMKGSDLLAQFLGGGLNGQDSTNQNSNS